MNRKRKEEGEDRCAGPSMDPAHSEVTSRHISGNAVSAAICCTAIWSAAPL